MAIFLHLHNVDARLQHKRIGLVVHSVGIILLNGTRAFTLVDARHIKIFFFGIQVNF